MKFDRAAWTGKGCGSVRWVEALARSGLSHILRFGRDRPLKRAHPNLRKGGGPGVQGVVTKHPWIL